MAVKVVCDFCNIPLEFYDGRYVTYRTKQVDTRHILPHLCRSCADRLDNMFARFNEPSERKLLDRMSEINEARREWLGTEG